MPTLDTFFIGFQLVIAIQMELIMEPFIQNVVLMATVQGNVIVKQVTMENYAMNVLMII